MCILALVVVLTTHTTSWGHVVSDNTILLYGASGSGKSTQIGELAELVYQRSNGQQIVRLYTADGGGYKTLQPHINLGLIEVVDLRGANPWMLQWTTEGKLPISDNPADREKKWIVNAERNARVGGWVFEGFTSFGLAMLGDLAQRAGCGEKIGQDAPIKLQGNAQLAGMKTIGADGITIGSNSPAHFGVVQSRLQALAFISFQLPGIVCWTALDQRGSDAESMAAVVGPDLMGKAKTAQAPQWFVWSFHLVHTPQEGSKAAEHRMYLTGHKDSTTPGAIALANNRMPLRAVLTEKERVISPTSLKRAFEVLEGAEQNATTALAKELGIG